MMTSLQYAGTTIQDKFNTIWSGMSEAAQKNMMSMSDTLYSRTYRYKNDYRLSAAQLHEKHRKRPLITFQPQDDGYYRVYSYNYKLLLTITHDEQVYKYEVDPNGMAPIEAPISQDDDEVAYHKHQLNTLYVLQALVMDAYMAQQELNLSEAARRGGPPLIRLSAKDFTGRIKQI